MSKDPADRPASARELAAELRRQTIHIPEPAPATPEPARPRRLLPLALAAAGLGLLIGGGVLLAMLTGGGTGDAVAVAPPPEPPAPEPPPAAAVEPEPAPEPEPPAPAGDVAVTLDLADPAAVRAAAGDGREVVVAGRVTYARPSGTGRVFRLGLAGADVNETFQVIWFPSAYAAMADAFGGEWGEDLLGREVRITGEASLSPYALPQVIVDDPAQIEVLDP